MEKARELWLPAEWASAAALVPVCSFSVPLVRLVSDFATCQLSMLPSLGKNDIQIAFHNDDDAFLI